MFACFVYIFVKKLGQDKNEERKRESSCDACLESSDICAVKFSHDAAVFTVNSEAIKDNFRFELCMKSFMGCNRHRAGT